MSLKTAVGVVLLIGVATTPAIAQGVAVGVKGGLNLATIPDFASAVDEAGLDISNRVGLAVGGFVAIPVAARLDIQPEFFYVQKGLRFDASTGPFQGDTTVELAYIEIPVPAVYRFASDRSRTGYVFAGPAFGFNTSAIVDVEGEEEQDVEDDVKDTEVSLAFGGGVSFGRVLAEARWTEGLTAVNEEGVFLGEDVRNRSFMILFGVRF